MIKWTRRSILRRSAALSTVTFLSPAIGPAVLSSALAASSNPLFTLGVASGDPWPDSVVLWTRLARDPLDGGGMGDAPIAVNWEIAADEGFQRIVQKGTATARAEDAHSIHVEAGGLEPHRWYWYRFNAKGIESAVGRTRTAPALDASNDRLRLALACCQHYEHGHYTAYRHMAGEDLDLVLHVGDYIYEYRAKDDRPRRHNSSEVKTLDAYRNRYALYKLDPDLQAAHAAFPWAAVPDDHEVENDYANDIEEHGRQSPEDFLQRRAAAYKAYYEHLPFRKGARPNGPAMRLHRPLKFGKLASINMLDTRQHRTDQKCWGKWSPRCDDALDTLATMLGPDQENWLDTALTKSGTNWDVLVQQVPIMQRGRMRDGQLMHHMDKWDGYVGARQRLFHSIQRRGRGGLVALSGDVHENWVGSLKADFSDPGSATLGTEFVGTSISSNGDGKDTKKSRQRMIEANPHLLFHNGQRGYARCEITADTWRTDCRVLPYVRKPGAPIATRASFVVDRKSNRLESA